MISRIVDRVFYRLALRRIGILWIDTEPEYMRDSDGYCWISYREGPIPSGITGYDLSGLKCPEDEAASIKALIVPKIKPSILRELMTFPETPSGRFMAGCLGSGLPVIIDLSSIRGWSAWQGTIGQRLRASIEGLRSMGCVFTGWSSVRASEREDKSRTFELEQPGWYSWNEISSMVAGKSSLILGPGVRLTDEARDRLVCSGILIRRKN